MFSRLRLKWEATTLKVAAVHSEFIMRNAEDLSYAYRGEMQKGKKWLSAQVSKSRMDKPEWSSHAGRLEGQIWCLPENKEAAKEALVSEGRRFVTEIIQQGKSTLDSIS
jgi:hypothetical protein